MGVVFERVVTADEMAEAVFRHADEATMILMAGAVADFRPAEIAAQKIKKQNGIPELKLEPTRDILAELARRHRPDQLLVGFAAETERVAEAAAAKLRSKGLDLMVANDVTQAGAGFDVDTNIVTLIYADGRQVALEKMSKADVARRVLDAVAELRKSVSVARPSRP